MNNITFYERIKKLCKEQKFLLRTVVESSGINYNSYNTCKRYGNLLRADEAVSLAKVLNTSVEYLVTGVQEPALLPKDLQDIINKYSSKP